MALPVTNISEQFSSNRLCTQMIALVYLFFRFTALHGLALCDCIPFWYVLFVVVCDDALLLLVLVLVLLVVQAVYFPRRFISTGRFKTV